MSPTARSLALFRARGFLAGVVEQTIPKTFIKRDLFGFVDIVAVKDDFSYFCQTTTSGNMSARCKKIEESENLKTLHGTCRRIVVHGWAKRGERGKAKRWVCSERTWFQATWWEGPTYNMKGEVVG